MSWIPEVWAKLNFNPNRLKTDSRMIANAIKNGDLTLVAELMKNVYEGSKSGSHIFGIYEGNAFVGKISEDLITRGSWAFATVASASAIFYGLTSNERKELKGRLDQKQAENDALRKTNDELVKSNAELVISNKELVVTNNGLVKAYNMCQVGIFTWLIGRK